MELQFRHIQKEYDDIRANFSFASNVLKILYFCVNNVLICRYIQFYSTWTAATVENQNTKQETTKTESTKKESTTTAHQHNFQPVYKTVHHDAQYTTKWVQDSAAWDETVSNGDAYDEPVYDLHNICYDCGMDLDAAGYTGEAVFEHIEAEMDNGGMGRYYNKRVQVDTIHHEGTTSVVHHDATGHNEQVLVKDAYDEQVIDHYECSCGATK